MSPTQIILYFNGQISALSQQLSVVLQTKDSNKIQSLLASQKPRLDHLRGYALCMEHAGFIDKATADQVFAMFDSCTPR